MSRILIVNDDGVRSPFLAPLARALAELGEVRVAVPLEERSWTGKSMTRIGVLRVHPFDQLDGLAAEVSGAGQIPDLTGIRGFAIEGTPSDCANLGIHQLFEERPDWVVSGINLGTNAGFNFVVNSGTVGAAMEAGLCGVPAIAISQRMSPEHHAGWMRERRLGGPGVDALIAAAAARSSRIVATVMAHGLPSGALLLNVNFPIGMTAETPARWVPILRNRYGSLFEPDGNGAYRHAGNLGDTWRDESLPTDKTVVEAGEIAVTPVDWDASGSTPEAPYAL